MSFTIVIVDDDTDIRLALHELFVDEGYQVFECSNAVDAQALLATLPPAIVLLDHIMPRMLGIELVRTEAPASLHRFILLTAHHNIFSPADTEQLAAWHVPVMFKPFDIEDILHQVRLLQPPDVDTSPPAASSGC